MSMSISSYGTASTLTSNPYRCQQRMQPPDPGKMAEDAFAALDTGSKGYLDQTDLESALSASGGDAEAMMTALDTDADGQVTQEEMTAVLQQMFSTQDRGQFDMRMAGDRPPPPPPPADATDEGFTLDQLTQMASDLAQTDSQRASEFSTLVDSFDSADTDGNGKLSREEAMSFLFGDDADASPSTADTTADNSSTNQNLMRQLMAVVRTYGNVGTMGNGAGSSADTASLSISV